MPMQIIWERKKWSNSNITEKKKLRGKKNEKNWEKKNYDAPSADGDYLREKKLSK